MVDISALYTITSGAAPTGETVATDSGDTFGAVSHNDVDGAEGVDVAEGEDDDNDDVPGCDSGAGDERSPQR